MRYTIHFTDANGHQIGETHTVNGYLAVQHRIQQMQTHATAKGIEIHAHIQQEKHVLKIHPQKAPVGRDTHNPYPKQGTSPSVCEILNRGD